MLFYVLLFLKNMCPKKQTKKVVKSIRDVPSAFNNVSTATDNNFKSTELNKQNKVSIFIFTQFSSLSRYPNEFLAKHLSEVNFKDRKRSLENKGKSAKKKISPFVTQYHPALPKVKNILMGKWHLIQNQPYLKEIFQEPPILSSQRKVVKRHLGKS